MLVIHGNDDPITSASLLPCTALYETGKCILAITNRGILHYNSHCMFYFHKWACNLHCQSDRRANEVNYYIISQCHNGNKSKDCFAFDEKIAFKNHKVEVQSVAHFDRVDLRAGGHAGWAQGWFPFRVSATTDRAFLPLERLSVVFIKMVKATILRTEWAFP